MESLLSVLAASLGGMEASPERLRMLLQTVSARSAKIAAEAGERGLELEADTLAGLYEIVESIDPLASAHVLQLLAAQSDEVALRRLAELLEESPPDDWQLTGIALSPLWKADAGDLHAFFEGLGKSHVQRNSLPVVLDLANFAIRSGRLREHPLKHAGIDFTGLLDEITQRLVKLEASPQVFGDSVEEVQRKLSECVALTVSLCDTLGLVGDAQAVPVLTGAMALSHRRIQTEAAGALAVLGDSSGRQRLIDLAEDAVARLRAVKYAEELGFEDQISEELRLPAALAESEFASWLSGPENFGFPPHSLELIDSRTQHWPSFDDPRNCYLFRYRYDLPSGPVSSIGISGPLTYAFSSDLADLSPDDIYAAFAGWQAEHEEIYETRLSQLTPAQHREAERLSLQLAREGYALSANPWISIFFGQLAVLDRVEREGQSLHVIKDDAETLCYPTGDSPAAISLEVVLCIYRGRKLLRTFNPGP